MLRQLVTFNKQIKEHKKYTPQTQYSRKFFWSWLKTLDDTKTSLDYGFPWFTFQAIEYLEKTLLPKSKVFEYGGGGSTIFFMRKNCEVYTVEHDTEWFKNIEIYFQKNNSSHWKGFLIQAEAGLTSTHPKISNPLHYYSDEARYKEMNFKKYASKIDDFTDDFFDLVLVDGRARPSCVYHSINKIKKGGLLVLDNTERAYYLENFKNILSEKFTKEIDIFGPVPYTMWFHKTTIWRKK